MFQSILLPTDGSDYSRTALQYGIYIAKKLDARLTGLHVIDIQVLQGPVLHDICSSASLSPGPVFFSVIEKALEARADNILREFRERCEKEGLRPEVKKATGIIDEEIINEGKNADLILLAQRGEHSPLSRSVLLGSTAEAVVRVRQGRPRDPRLFHRDREHGHCLRREPARRSRPQISAVMRSISARLCVDFRRSDVSSASDRRSATASAISTSSLSHS